MYLGVHYPGYMTTVPIWIEPHYFPSIKFLEKLYRASAIFFAVDDFYQRRNYGNRCYLSTPQGSLRLTVPVVGATTHGVYGEVLIENRRPWWRTHWRTLATLYKQTPFYPFFSDLIRPIFTQPPQRLIDLDIAILRAHIAFLQWELPIYCVSANKVPSDVMDLRGTMRPHDHLLHNEWSAIQTLCAKGPIEWMGNSDI